MEVWEDVSLTARALASGAIVIAAIKKEVVMVCVRVYDPIDSL